MQDPTEDVALSRLTHDLVQNTYKEMHSLLDSLSDLEPEARREKLLDFTLKARHRFARLLVAVRWFMMYSAFHGSAHVTKKMASTRSAVLTNNADILWQVSAFVKGAAAAPSAITEAAEVLGASSFYARFPRMIEAVIGLDTCAGINKLDDTPKDISPEDRIPTDCPSKDYPPKDITSKPIAIEGITDGPLPENDLTSEAAERLRVTTLYVVENSLPSGVVVINTSVGPGRAAVRIGVPGAWTADLILDRLKVDIALLVLLRFEILVGGHPDALGAMYTPWRVRDSPMKLQKQQFEPLRQMINDRVSWEIRAAEAVDKESRMQSGLICLGKVLSLECAGKIAIEHVRHQASSLIYQSSWKRGAFSLTGVGSEASDDTPVRIHYWQKSHLKATLSISLPSEEFQDWKSGILHVRHNPELPGRTAQGLFSPHSIHMENIVLETCRIRAEHELRQLRSFCSDASIPFIQTKIVSWGSASSLNISFEGHGPGLSFGISLKTGGYFVRSHGTVSLAQTGTHLIAVEFRTSLWTGERFFTKSSLHARKGIAIGIVKKASSLLRCHSALNSSCAIDAGFLPAWPPGDSFVEKPEETKGGKRIGPPFMAIDRKRPRRFLTLRSVANEDDEVYFHPGLSVSKRARSLPMQFSLSLSESHAFIEGRRPEGVVQPIWSKDLISGASGMAEWAEVRHATEIRMRRDNILRQLESVKIATVVDGDYSLRSPSISEINMKSSHLQVSSASLVIQGDEGWQIQLTLTNDTFDATNVRGQTVSYFPEKRLLTFSYSLFSVVTLRWFCRDFERAVNSAALISGLSESSPNESSSFSVIRREPSHVEVEVSKVRLKIGVRSQSFQIEVVPPRQLVSAYLIPFFEELMQAPGSDAGSTLAELLDLSLPMGLALEDAVPRESSVIQVKFSTALRVRLMISLQPRQPSFAVDIDARDGFHGFVITDVHRGLTMNQNDTSAIDRRFKPIPVWDALVKQIVAKKFGLSARGGSAMRVRSSVLSIVLVSIVKSLLPRGGNS